MIRYTIFTCIKHWRSA